eukprot:GFUD01043031.1.p1 GENE.GFUD01043031.1~~GFUD01043031.1.p1  ORF type:complete len:411 (+),score=72.90 GFUD01043031.1:145-1377(+)
MSFSVVDSFTVLYLLSLLLMVIITNIKPHIGQETAEIETIHHTREIDLQEELMVGVVTNQFIVFIIGGLGNLLTLVAIPYVRKVYGAEFSLLKLNSVVLILHLSFADLLYCVLGFPHFIQIYFSRTGPEDDRLCYALGMLRNLVAYVDFNTIAMISCCVARQNLCRQCAGASLTHDDHDKIFGGKRVYLVCLAIWVVSFLTILPEVMGYSGVFAWTGSPYGCDTVCPSEGCSNIGPFISIINNIIFMILFYAVIVIKMCMKRHQSSEFTSMLKSISLTLSILIAAYLAFLIPVVSSSWRLWPVKTSFLSYKAKAIIASIYWWMYGINFFIYLFSSSRIRETYRTFIKDMWKKIFKRSNVRFLLTFNPIPFGLLNLRNHKNHKSQIFKERNCKAAKFKCNHYCKMKLLVLL